MSFGLGMTIFAALVLGIAIFTTFTKYGAHPPKPNDNDGVSEL